VFLSLSLSLSRRDTSWIRRHIALFKFSTRLNKLRGREHKLLGFQREVLHYFREKRTPWRHSPHSSSRNLFKRIASVANKYSSERRDCLEELNKRIYLLPFSPSFSLPLFLSLSLSLSLPLLLICLCTFLLKCCDLIFSETLFVSLQYHYTLKNDRESLNETSRESRVLYTLPLYVFFIVFHHGIDFSSSNARLRQFRWGWRNEKIVEIWL